MVAERALELTDRHARLQLVADRAAPMALARERTLPVLEALVPLFPEGALRRGTVVGVSGSGLTTLALAVAAGPSASGSWIAMVGDPDIGLAAAEEIGVALERLMVVTADPGSWASSVAALVGAVDIVIAAPPAHVRAGDARRLSARLRERGSVLVCLGARWPDTADVTLDVVESRWHGIGEGHGLLRSRTVVVDGGGRGAAARPRSARLLLPDAHGAVVGASS